MNLNLSKSKLFLYSCFAYIIGTGIASFLPINIIKNDLSWLILAMIFLIFVILSPSRRRGSRMFLSSLFLLILSFSFFRYSLAIPLVNENNIQFYNNQKLQIVGVVKSDPEVKVKNQKFTVETHCNASLQPCAEGKVLINTRPLPKYSYGDELNIECELEAPVEFNGFAYDRYLAKSNIYSVCYYPKIEKTADNNGNQFFAFIYSVKNKIREIISSGLTPNEVGIARAMILGDKYAVSNEKKEVFARAGVSHMMAISGMHIGVLFGIIMVIMYELGFWRRQIFYYGLPLLCLYVVFIGMPASAVRALLMIFLILLAQVLQRLNKIDRSVYFTATILLLINPKLLRDDVGFQLSFLAILAIVYLYPIFDNYLERYKNLQKHLLLKASINIFLLTTAIQLFTLPILVYNFGQISLIAPLVNVLILWCLPFLLIMLLLAILLSSVLPAFSFIFFTPVKILITFIVNVSELVNKIPSAYVRVENMWYVVLFYIVLAGAFYAVKGKNRGKYDV